MRSARTHATAPAPDHLSTAGPHSTTGAVGPPDPAGTGRPVVGIAPAEPPDAAEPRPPGAIGTPFLRWESLPDDALDASIRPLVRALNETGWVRTVFSCGGHPEEHDSVARGRRQAHVDVATSDLRRWLHFTSRSESAALAAAARVAAGGARLRVAEDTLGSLPSWLVSALPPPIPPGARWHYRRLVFEPIPYDLDPTACRLLLDAALAAALEALAPDLQDASARV